MGSTGMTLLQHTDTSYLTYLAFGIPWGPTAVQPLGLMGLMEAVDSWKPL